MLRELYRDRWPVEQLPLAAKQMLGAARQFVHEQETCQRFPELALLAGAVLTYAAATSPAVPTGSWDRQPRRTPGRLRRLLGQAAFPTDFPLPERLRGKVAVTDHLPKGWWGQRRRPSPTSPSSGTPVEPVNLDGGRLRWRKVKYQQLLKYREDLENPPLLVVCDLDRFEVHTNFTGTAKQVYAFDLADLAGQRADAATARSRRSTCCARVFTDPARLRPDQTPAQVTEEAAARVRRLADEPARARRTTRSRPPTS